MKKQAFSLVELILVIVILGVIAAVAVPKLFGTKDVAKATTIKQDVSTITSSIQSYYLINNKLNKLTDAVNINTTVWDVSDKKAIFKENGKNCITIEVDSGNLTVDIDEISGELCQKIFDIGVQDRMLNLQ